MCAFVCVIIEAADEILESRGKISEMKTLAQILSYIIKATLHFSKGCRELVEGSTEKVVVQQSEVFETNAAYPTRN